MFIIARTRRGYKSYTEYNLEDQVRLKNFKKNIDQIGKSLKNAERVEERAHKEALLKFVCINLWQTTIINTAMRATFVNNIYQYIFAKLDGCVITKSEWQNDPENLFTLPKYATQKSSHRKIIGYDKNETASLCFEVPRNFTQASQSLNSIKIETNLEKNQEKVEKNLAENNSRVQDVLQSAARIQEHARRRVELFFFLCISLYNKKRQVVPGQTNKQHGQAKKEGFEACHSSLFPGISDSPYDIKTRARKDVSIFLDTFISESFNLTMELPKCVNIVDRLLEGRNTEKGTRLRQKLLPVLNKVSLGEVSPLCAMNTFFVIVNNFLNNNKQFDRALDKDTTYAPALAKKYVKLYEEQGTFYWTDKTKLAPSIEATSCWLRVSSSTAALFMHDANQKKCAHENISRIQSSFQLTLLSRYASIQKEALSIKCMSHSKTNNSFT